MGSRFDELKRKYAEVNTMLGNIIKVTPSSKIVGDLALFMLQNDYSADDVCDKEKMRSVAFPDSVKDYLSGGIGIPHVGMN